MTQNKENETDIYTYNGNPVTIITVFNDERNATAIIEDKNGEILEVPKDALR